MAPGGELVPTGATLVTLGLQFVSVKMITAALTVGLQENPEEHLQSGNVPRLD